MNTVAAPNFPSDGWDLLETVVKIASPTFAEEKRARFIQEWIRGNTPWKPFRDPLNNVIVDTCSAGGKAILLDAHIDTVFTDEVVAVTKKPGRWVAPGIIDDTAAAVLLMLLLRELGSRREKLGCIVSFTVCEESKGGLAGIRAVVERFRERLDCVLCFDSQIDFACRQAPASLIWDIEFSGPGGHAWAAYGRPNPVLAMAQLLNCYEKTFEWQQGVCSWNMNVLRGGEGISAIPTEAAFRIATRATDADELNRRVDWLQAKWRSIAAGHALECNETLYGKRPAGIAPAQHPLVDCIVRTQEEIGLPLEWRVASTNANLPASYGIPAYCTGLCAGEHNHSPREYLETDSLLIGWNKLNRLAQRCAALASSR